MTIYLGATILKETFHCDICNKQLSNKQSFKLHFLKTHKIERKNIKTSYYFGNSIDIKAY